MKHKLLLFLMLFTFGHLNAGSSLYFYESDEDPFTDVKVTVNGVNLYQSMPSTFYTSYLPYQYGKLNTPKDIGSYFINFSDGEPYFHNKDIYYAGEKAWQHTKKQVEEYLTMKIE